MGGSANGVREESETQTFGRPSSLPNPKLGGEVGGGRSPSPAESTAQGGLGSNEAKGDPTFKAPEEKLYSDGNFHVEPKNPPSIEVKPTKMEGPQRN